MSIRILPKTRKRIDNLNRFLYASYLRNKLSIKYVKGPPKSIAVGNKSYTRYKLNQNVTDVLDTQGSSKKLPNAFGRSALDLAMLKGVQDKLFLETFYDLFKTTGLKNIDNFNQEDALVKGYLKTDALQYIEEPKKGNSLFGIKEISLRLTTIEFKIILSDDSSDTDKETSLRSIGLLLGLLTTGKNSLSRTQELFRIKASLNKVQNSIKASEKYVSIIGKQLDQISKYLGNNPIWIGGKMIAKALAYPFHSATVLGFLILGSIGAIMIDHMKTKNQIKKFESRVASLSYELTDSLTTN